MRGVTVGEQRSIKLSSTGVSIFFKTMDDPVTFLDLDFIKDHRCVYEGVLLK